MDMLTLFIKAAYLSDSSFYFQCSCASSGSGRPCLVSSISCMELATTHSCSNIDLETYVDFQVLVLSFCICQVFSMYIEKNTCTSY